MQEVSFKAGDILGVDGVEGEHVFLIAQGQVAVLRNAQDLGTCDLGDPEVDDIVSEETLGLCSAVTASAQQAQDVKAEMHRLAVQSARQT